MNDKVSDASLGSRPVGATPPPAPTTAGFPIVAVGASAGGLKALLKLFEHMPSGSGMAFVVILHLSPDYESHAHKLLQGVTHLNVCEVHGPTKVEPEHVYVIPPDCDLTIADETLDLTGRGKQQRHNTAIDLFFRALAQTHQQRAFCIVLSGTGADGSLGLKTIREHGGIGIAQDPEEAEYGDMPRSAIATGGADFVLPVNQMPQKLLELWQNARRIKLPPLEARPSTETIVEQAEDALREILAIVRTRTGNDFLHYKRATLLRRIERRLQVNQLGDLPSYRDFLRGHPSETRALLQDLLISVTLFFRDRASFEALENDVIPALFRDKSSSDSVRVWVVGCATGEEVYSIAMMLSERAAKLSSPPALQVFATDIDDNALAFARQALYPDTVVANVSLERLGRFFSKEPRGYRVQKSLRDLVMFATHNILRDPPFSRVDLVCCRNVLIYLNRHVQGKVLDTFNFSLRPNGFLLLGSSESVDEAHAGFVVVNKSQRIFRTQARARAGLFLSSLPTVAQPAPNVPALAENPPGRRQISYGDLHQSLLEHYAPPSVVVDELNEIVHLSDRAGRYLEFGGGEASLNVLQVVPTELRFDLRQALDSARETMHTVELRRITVERGSYAASLNLRVHPLRDAATGRTFALVIFDESEVAKEQKELSAADDEAGAGAPGSAAGHLAAELRDTRTQLRAATEQYGVQNEELKASNEELQATNEELRAATEELETGKEELQSINEELTTVNQELKNKVDEATRVNDDLQNFIASTDIAVIFVDRELRLCRYTPPAQELFNVIRADVGRSLLDITHQLDYPELADDIHAVLEKLQAVERECKAANGRFYLIHVLPYRTADDRIGGVTLTFIDTTRRLEAEQRVRHDEQWLRLVVDSIDYALFTLDADGRISWWNAGAERTFGYKNDEVIGRPFDLLFAPEDRAAGVPAQELAKARAEGKADDDRWHMRKDGERFFVNGVTARLADGEVYGFVKIARDVTAHQKLLDAREEQLSSERVNRAAAEEANRLKDEFLATLSHELRNPLSLILMQCDLLLRAPEVAGEPKLTRATNIIHQMVSTQAQLVEDLLDVSRAKMGKLSIHQQLLPLPFIIADSIGAVRQDADVKRITLDVQLTSEPLIVAADIVRIKQIAWNLLSNALKFTPAGGRVEVRLQRDEEQARLDVIDNGQGIDPEFLPQIFEWFRQGDASPTRRQGGMGIGLALVRQLVELQGGRVAVDSAGIGKGARFTVWLPLHIPPTTAKEPGAVDDQREQQLDGLRILVIDDTPASAESLRDLLEIEGARVKTALNGAQAINVAREEEFDLFISDIAMPGMDGHHLLPKLRAMQKNTHTPAIAYTGYGRTNDVQKALDAGFQMHLTKPLDLARLIEAIRVVAPDRAPPARE